MATQRIDTAKEEEEEEEEEEKRWVEWEGYIYVG